MLDNKKADNFAYNKKKELNDLDDKIYDNKTKINKLIDMQETLVSLDLSVNKCIDLLSESVKGARCNAIYNDILETNRKNFYSSLDIIEKNVDTLRKNINDLIKEKEAKTKKQNNNEENVK